VTDPVQLDVMTHPIYLPTALLVTAPLALLVDAARVRDTDGGGADDAGRADPRGAQAGGGLTARVQTPQHGNHGAMRYHHLHRHG